MNDKYAERVLKHYKIQTEVLFELMKIAQRLCPDGEWVFQLLSHSEWSREEKIEQKKFMAVVTNGDDNVTAICANPGAAVALLVHYLLDGSVFPLTGNGGVKTFPGDNGWIKEIEDVESEK